MNIPVGVSTGMPLMMDLLEEILQRFPKKINSTKSKSLRGLPIDILILGHHSLREPKMKTTKTNNKLFDKSSSFDPFSKLRMLFKYSQVAC